MPRYRSKAPQVIRCLALLVEMLRARRGVSPRMLAERRDWTLRSVYRDLETLRELGVPVEEPEHGWYRVPSAWIPVASVDVTRDEMDALAVAGHLASGLRNTGLGRALDGLRGKLAGTMQRLLELDVWWTGRAAAIDYGDHRETVERVCTAAKKRLALRIHYRKATGEKSQRVIEPALVHWEPSTETLYVRGWCRLREAQRTFAVHRIESAELTDEPFAPHRDAAHELTKAFRLWSRPGVERVVLHFAQAVAGEIRERRWHASQRLADLPDGSVVLEMQVAAPEELERMILGYGPDVVVEAPERLAARIRERHALAIEPRRMSTRAVSREGGERRACEGR